MPGDRRRLFDEGPLQQLFREIQAYVRNTIAEALQRNGISPGRIDGTNITGQVPIGSARFIVQKDGVQVGAPVYVLNFIGDGFTVTADPSHNRANIGLAFANGPDQIVDDVLDSITDDASAVVYA